MPTQILRLTVDAELGALLALYTRAGETPRTAVLKALRLRAGADGHLGADGKPKRGSGRISGRPA